MVENSEQIDRSRDLLKDQAKPIINQAKIVGETGMKEKREGASFDAMKSNSKLFHENPVLQINPSTKPKKMSNAEKGEDVTICNGFATELTKHDLLPNNQTFYLLDFGLPHAPALQKIMLEMEIDPAIFLQPSEKRLKNAPDYYRRYFDSYTEHEDELIKLRGKLNPKGYAIQISSHSDISERAEQSKILPSIEKLKERGISRVVIGVETYYDKPLSVEDYAFPATLSNSEGLFLNRYAHQLKEAGIKVFIIGFDYRYKK